MIGKKTDWAEIKKQYIAGILSVEEIARQHGITSGAIRKRRARKDWPPRDKAIAQRVREKVRDNLVRGAVREDKASAKKEPTDEEIINEAAKQAVEVVALHRADIRKLREMELSLLSELGGADGLPPTKLHICQYQGVVIETVVTIPVTERASALQSLAAVQYKRIILERQAWNLDDEGVNSEKFLVVMD